jgi:hypothetical protein
MACKILLPKMTVIANTGDDFDHWIASALT